MSTINPASASTASTAAMSAAQRGTQTLMGDTQDRFLTLLVTQLKNQDPLNPLDNNEVTSQIAQLSTVNGINQLNNTLLALAGQMDVSQSMQAASLIGKQVLVPGAKVLLGGEDGNKVATPFGIDLISSAAKITVNILDAGGMAVRKLELGPQPEGVASVGWDGKGEGGVELAAGAYTVQVTAVGGDGAPVGVNPLMAGKVASVVNTGQGPKLDLGLAGTFSLLDIKKIM
jgi:flagellar basal-body rod modification protein FlgD